MIPPPESPSKGGQMKNLCEVDGGGRSRNQIVINIQHQ